MYALKDEVHELKKVNVPKCRNFVFRCQWHGFVSYFFKAPLCLLTFWGVKKCGRVHTHIISIHENQSNVMTMYLSSYLLFLCPIVSFSTFHHIQQIKKDMWHNTWFPASLLTLNIYIYIYRYLTFFKRHILCVQKRFSTTFTFAKNVNNKNKNETWPPE